FGVPFGMPGGLAIGRRHDLRTPAKFNPARRRRHPKLLAKHGDHRSLIIALHRLFAKSLSIGNR
ncbi:MAG: hypothetical protein WBX25_31650, partial [Rhodomicrobium sp.]